MGAYESVGTVRSMASYDLDAVQRIYAAAHRGWPPKLRVWFLANPTLVYSIAGVAGEHGPKVVGHTSLMVDTVQGVAHYRDVCVDPAYAGRGIGRELVVEREKFARLAGARIFYGCTWDGNAPMVRIFEELSYHRCQRLPGHFAHNDPPADGWIWVKADA
jgi:GNAT superfamily N-acetyltransferase